jgi:hypothetical protein
MKVFCYDCGTSEETDWLVRCPKCESKGSIGIEETKDWDGICRLWAISKRWQRDNDELSLPWWFEKNPEYLSEWKTFKAQLTDPEFPPLPEFFVERHDIFDFWVKRSGVFSLRIGTEFELIHDPSIGPLVRQLATIYADHHCHKRQRGEAGTESKGIRKRSHHGSNEQGGIGHDP